MNIDDLYKINDTLAQLINLTTNKIFCKCIFVFLIKIENYLKILVETNFKNTVIRIHLSQYKYINTSLTISEINKNIENNSMTIHKSNYQT